MESTLLRRPRRLEIKQTTKRSYFFVPPIDRAPQVPETELEIQRYEAALRRKQLSLVGRKIKPSRCYRALLFLKSFF
jgi:hypothetical protein